MSSRETAGAPISITGDVSAAGRAWAWARRHRELWPAAGLIGLAIIAYWFTLSSLADYMRLDTPLAYLIMLPLFSALVAVATVLRYQGRPRPSREPHLDLLVGVPILLVALLLIAVLPTLWSTYYWTERPDVVSLALFLCGGVTVCYGISWAWRLRGALGFIVLAWPALYLHLMAGVMQSFTDGTNSVLTAVAGLLPFHVTSSSGGILTVPTGAGGTISMVLSTACSGANGVLGILLVGAALALVLEGKRSRKLLWLLCGTVIVFALNIVRIISILWLASTGHSDLALGSYHAVIGLTLFTLTLLLMLALSPLFGLSLGALVTPPARRPPAPVRTRSLGRARYPAAIGVLLIAALTVLAERDLASYAAFIDGTGAPTVKVFDVNDPLPRGWTASYVTTYVWAKQYFGGDSEFSRYNLTYGPGYGDQAWMDVVRTGDQGSLDAYNLQACFLFHNYTLHSSDRIDIGHGVTALLVNYTDPVSRQSWATVSWAWPVLYQDGTSYERIAITSPLNAYAGRNAPDPEPSSGLRGVVLSIVNSFGGGETAQTAQVYGGADRALKSAAAALVGNTIGGRAS